MYQESQEAPTQKEAGEAKSDEEDLFGFEEAEEEVAAKKRKRSEELDEAIVQKNENVIIEISFSKFERFFFRNSCVFKTLITYIFLIKGSEGRGG
jgi:hypothetical protein